MAGMILPAIGAIGSIGSAIPAISSGVSGLGSALGIGGAGSMIADAAASPVTGAAVGSAAGAGGGLASTLKGMLPLFDAGMRIGDLLMGGGKGSGGGGGGGAPSPFPAFGMPKIPDMMQNQQPVQQVQMKSEYQPTAYRFSDLSRMR